MSKPKSGFVPIIGYGDKYVINNKGIVKNLCKPPGNNRLRIVGLDKGQSLRVNLSHGGTHESLRLDMLVAYHFVENPHNYRYINNISGDKSDVSADNLEYVEHPVTTSLMTAKAVEEMALAYLESDEVFSDFASRYSIKTATARKYVVEWCTNNDRLKEYREQTHKRQIEFLNTRKTEAYKPVIRCTKAGVPIEEYPSISAAARDMGCKVSSISRALGAHYRTSGGFKWKYKSPKKTQK